MKITKQFAKIFLDNMPKCEVRIKFLIKDITAESVQVHITGVDSETGVPMLDMANFIMPEGGEITLDIPIPLEISFS